MTQPAGDEEGCSPDTIRLIQRLCILCHQNLDNLRVPETGGDIKLFIGCNTVSARSYREGEISPLSTGVSVDKNKLKPTNIQSD